MLIVRLRFVVTMGVEWYNKVEWNRIGGFNYSCMDIVWLFGGVCILTPTHTSEG